jgi:pimeloyl-ACP methyl ester carboxylesterase
VLLVMGYGVPGRAWVHQVPALSREHRVAWYDHRGCGATEAAPGAYDMALLAGDACRLLDHLGWDRAHLVGVSMGGMVSQELALAHPDRLLSLTLIATHPGGPRARLPGLRGSIGFLRANTARTRQRRFEALKRLLFPEPFLARCDPQWLDDVLQADFGRRVPALLRLSQLAAVMRHDTRDRLHRLGDIPTLIVKPGQDLLVRPSQSDLLARLIPNARLLTFPDAGHGVVRQCHAELNPALLLHFARAEAAR